MKRIAIFASGSGTNAENLIRYFQKSAEVRVQMVFTNNPQAGVIDRAKRLGIPTCVFNRKEFNETDKIENILQDLQIDLIVLAGFLWLVPEKLIRKFTGRIINIHPALLPKYGGKGFYGIKVHEGVIAAGEKKSGITIHFVNEKFDEGEIVFQIECEIGPDDTPGSLADKVHQLEYKYFPKVVHETLKRI